MLAKLQEDFANHIYNKKDLNIFRYINSGKIPAQERLQIYRNNVLGSFDDAMALTYEIIKKIVGDAYFFQLTNKYHHKYYSNSGNLEDYGNHFSQLLKSLEKEHKLPYLSDIARIEWLHNLSYFANEVEDLDIKTLQSLSENDFMSLTFELHPSCHLIASKYPIYSIWNSNINDLEDEINLEEKKAQFIMIQRALLKVNVHELTQIDYDFLNMIKEGKNIYKIYQKLERKQKDFDIGSLINKFISSRIITNFKVGNV